MRREAEAEAVIVVVGRSEMDACMLGYLSIYLLEKEQGVC